MAHRNKVTETLLRRTTRVVRPLLLNRRNAMKFCALVFLALTVFAGVMVIGSESPNDYAKQLRDRLSSIVSIDDDDKFLFAYWGFLRENGIDILLKKGDRVSLGKSVVILKSDGTFEIRDANDDATTTKALSHFILTTGRCIQSEDRPANATHFVLSTDDAVFVTDLISQRVSILKR